MEFAFFLYLFQGTEAMIRAQRKQSNRSKKQVTSNLKQRDSGKQAKKEIQTKKKFKNKKRKGAAR